MITLTDKKTKNHKEKAELFRAAGFLNPQGRQKSGCLLDPVQISIDVSKKI